MPLKELLAQVKNWIREDDAAWQFCQDPELMVEEAFLHVTDEEVKNYIHHAEYFKSLKKDLLLQSWHYCKFKRALSSLRSFSF